MTAKKTKGAASEGAAPVVRKVGRYRRIGVTKGEKRSSLEVSVDKWLTRHAIPINFEPCTFGIEIPARKSYYKPDYILPNGIVIEAKGEFTSSNRKHYKAFRAAYPAIDFRILFGNPNAKLGSKSKTTYAMWCEREGIRWGSFKTPPDDWLTEPINRKSLAAIKAASGWQP